MPRIRISPSRLTGFTVVELLIVIVVIGIIASVSIVGYRGVSERSVNNQLKSDIANAFDQLELDYLNTRAYPATAAEVNGNSGFKLTPGTTISYLPAGDRQSYCVQVSSSKAGTKTFKVIQEGVIQEGTCPAAPPPQTPGSLSGSGFCYSIGVDGEGSITLTWPSVASSSAPTYKVYQSGTNGNQQRTVTNTNSSPADLSTTFTVGPMAYSVGGSYTFTVRALNSVGTESSDSPNWQKSFAPYEC